MKRDLIKGISYQGLHVGNTMRDRAGKEVIVIKVLPGGLKFKIGGDHGTHLWNTKMIDFEKPEDPKKNKKPVVKRITRKMIEERFGGPVDILD